jgi:mortality factor 4-like protein 1
VPILPVINELPIAAQMRSRRHAAAAASSAAALDGAYVPQDASLVQIAMPDELIQLLMRGQAWVKDAGFTLPLPRSPSVIDILNEFVRDGNDVDRALRLEASHAFVAIFDACFPLLLLYKNERAQFERLKALERRGPSTVYGAEHLLRFLSRAPDVLGTVRMERDVLINYERMLNVLALFLKSKRFDYFLAA